MNPSDDRNTADKTDDPGRTPGQAEGLDEDESKNTDNDPGRTGGQAEGEDED